MHIEYIEQQLNLIRFSSDRAFDIAKFHGALEYFFFSKLIDPHQFDFYLGRAIVFLNNPDQYPASKKEDEAKAEEERRQRG